MTKRRQSSASSNDSRQLMYEWLVENANQELHGLTWLDKQKKILRIPWKHASKQSFDLDNDSQLFRAWALHTNKYAGCESDSKKWKANFRCALNSLKKQIVYEKSRSESRGENSFRAYRLLPKNVQAKAKQSGRFKTSKRRRISEPVSEPESWDSPSSGVGTSDEISEAEGDYSSTQSELQPQEGLYEPNQSDICVGSLEEVEVCNLEIVDVHLGYDVDELLKMDNCAFGLTYACNPIDSSLQLHAETH